MAPRKRDTQVQKDGQTVYKPAKKAKTVVKEEPEDKKPVRLKPARTKTGRLKPEAEKEEKKPDKKPPRRYEPEQKLTGREKKEKARAAAVARDRRRAVSRAGDGCVTMIALLTAVFEVLGLLLCAAKAEGAWDTQAVRLCMVRAPLGLLPTLALPRLLPMDSLVMALTNFLCGVGVVVLYTVSPERGARQAMFYAMGLAAMLVMSEIVFHVRHFRGLTLLGMALGIGALILPLAFGEWKNGAKNWVSVPLLGSFQPSEIVKLSVVLALAYFFSAHRTVWQMMPALLFAAACLLLLMMQRDLGTALIYYLTTLVLFYVACGNVPLTVVGLGGGGRRGGLRDKKGSALRGGAGRVFKRSGARQQRHNSCGGRDGLPRRAGLLGNTRGFSRHRGYVHRDSNNAPCVRRAHRRRRLSRLRCGIRQRVRIGGQRFRVPERLRICLCHAHRLVILRAARTRISARRKERGDI